jgi:hypothetical protein
MFQTVLIENMCATDIDEGTATERTARLGKCLERVSISITPTAWIRLYYLFVWVIMTHNHQFTRIHFDPEC